MINQREFAKFVLLSIVTCGIYAIIFYYKMVKDINKLCEGDGESTKDFIITILLTIVTCGIYYLIWVYKLGNRLQKNGPRYNLTFTKNGTLFLLITVVGMLLSGSSAFSIQTGFNIFVNGISLLGAAAAFVVAYFVIEEVNAMANAYNSFISNNDNPENNGQMNQ